MKEAIYSIARLSHVHESSKGLNSGFSFVLSSAAGRNRISEIRYITSNSTATVFNILLKIQFIISVYPGNFCKIHRRRMIQSMKRKLTNYKR